MTTAIRQQAPTEGRLRRYIAQLSQLSLPVPLPDDMDQRIGTYEMYVGELGLIEAQLSNGYNLLVAVHSAWLDAIAATTGADREAEEQAYEDAVAEERSLVKDIDTAQEALVNVRIRAE